MNEDIEEKLWELRLKVLDTVQGIQFEHSKKSVENKISGFGENDILMQPEAMQHVVAMLEQARHTNDKINTFGRSRPSVQIKNEVDEQERQAEGILARFGRSVKVSDEPTAADMVEKSLVSKRKTVTPKERFKAAMNDLEAFLKANGLQHTLRCKQEHLSEEDHNKMIKEAQSLETDNPSDKVKVLQQVKRMKKETLYGLCKNKPYQCLSCPYYYQDMAEFFKMKKNKKEADHEAGTP